MQDAVLKTKPRPMLGFVKLWTSPRSRQACQDHREGILPDYPNNRVPQFDFDSQQLIVPSPHHAREDIQEPFVRDHEIPPEKYYPEGYQPGVLDEWPVDGELVAPVDVLPEKMYQSMSENWQTRKAYETHINELTAEND